LKKPVGLVPSSGRPCSDATTVTSEYDLRMLRIWGTSLLDSSSEIVDGIVARTQSAPSSRWGMNSEPIRVVRAIARAKTTTDAMIVARTWARHQSSARA
jgi:hypothetical protein